MGTISAMTIRKRNSRKVAGGAYGKPYFAPRKPELQSRTKTAGAAASQGETTPVWEATAADEGAAATDEVAAATGPAGSGVLLIRTWGCGLELVL